MNKTKHTPGPWEVRQKDMVWSASTGRLIADCEKTPYLKRPAPPDSEDASNARLIAAAPELLEALENARNVLAGLATGQLAGIEKDSPALEKARAAITKAKGN